MNKGQKEQENKQIGSQGIGMIRIIPTSTYQQFFF